MFEAKPVGTVKSSLARQGAMRAALSTQRELFPPRFVLVSVVVLRLLARALGIGTVHWKRFHPSLTALCVRGRCCRWSPTWHPAPAVRSILRR